MPASGVSRQPTDGPDDTHRGLATRVAYIAQGSDGLQARAALLALEFRLSS